MRRKWIVAIFGVVGIVGGCDRAKTQSAEPSSRPSAASLVEGEGRVEWVDPKTLKPGPIRRETLSDEQLARIKAIHAAFAEVDSSTLEECLDGFKRDVDPDRELAIWERMVKAYERYVKPRSLSIEAKKEVFQIVLLRSMSPEDEVLPHLKLTVLSREEAMAVMRGF